MADTNHTILQHIRGYVERTLDITKTTHPLKNVIVAASAAPPVRDFTAALDCAARTGYALIAEIKRASPSKGLIRADFNPSDLARAFAKGGATCLSVLTDAPSFQGDRTHLIQARASVDLPILRKDFLHDPYQVVESRAMGADCILLILANVSDAEAQELVKTAQDWDLSVLAEVHTEQELERALRLPVRLIGINNRDLHTFATDVHRTRTLAALVPPDRLIISESGLNTRDDLDDLAGHGVRCFLIGESLMRQQNVTAATRALLHST